MDVSSQHFLADVWLETSLDDKTVAIITGIIEKRLTVIEKYEYQFEPQGTTIVYILAESHFAMHVYPEHDYFTLDIYVCNRSIDLDDVFDEIARSLKISHIDRQNIMRGNAPQKKTGYSQRQSLSSVYTMTFVVAACSILYELLIAQALSAIMGNSVLRYNLTIGTYIASMGVGALMFNRFRIEDKYHGLSIVELLLCVLGGFSPLLILAFDSLLHQIAVPGFFSYHGQAIQGMSFVFNHLLILIVGFLSGLELPYLMSMGKERSAQAEKRVLVIDYFGTLAGALLFPLIIFPSMKLFNIGYMVSLINCAVALFLVFKIKGKKTGIKLIAGLVFLIYLIVIFNSEGINNYFIETLYMGTGK
jgi:spermidine synthase